jgi:tellurite resistance protein
MLGPIPDVANAPTSLELTEDLEASFARAGVAPAALAFVRDSARGVVVTREKAGVRLGVPALASGADYALGVALAAAAARLAGTTVSVEDQGAPAGDVTPDELIARWSGEVAVAHARSHGGWLVDDAAAGRTYFFFGPRGWTKLEPVDVAAASEADRFDRARAILAPQASAASGAPDARRVAVLFTAAMMHAASADGRIDPEERRQIEAHFATVKELAGFAPTELLEAAYAERSVLASIGELSSPALRRKAFVLAAEILASARDGKLLGDASDPNVQAVDALARALGLEGDQVFLAQVVRTVMTKYAKLPTDDATADDANADVIMTGMLLAAAADGHIDEQETALLAALSRTVPEIASRDAAAILANVEGRVAVDAEKELGALAGRCAGSEKKNKCFAVAAEVALVAGRGPEGTLLPRLRERLAPDTDVADSAVATFAAKYA